MIRSVTILTGAGPHSCACSGNTYTLTFEATCGSSASFSIFHNNSGGGNDCSITATGISLPVTWLDFKLARKTDNFISLNWSTAVEVNNKHFEIEHSKDGKNFLFLGTILGAGTSYQKKDYDYVHMTNNKGISYYRIKQVDLDENYTYSEIRSIKANGSSEYLIYPNPANETLNISGNKENVQFHIMDTNGNKIISTKDSQIDIKNLIDGVYLLLIEKDKNIQRLQFIKSN